VKTFCVPKKKRKDKQEPNQQPLTSNEFNNMQRGKKNISCHNKRFEATFIAEQQKTNKNLIA